jgi:methyltransferase (TIGR00027 family)
MSVRQKTGSALVGNHEEQATRDVPSGTNAARDSLQSVQGQFPKADVGSLDQKWFRWPDDKHLDRKLDALGSDDKRKQLAPSLPSAGMNALKASGLTKEVRMNALKASGPTQEALNARVANPHALTARAVASARAEESKLADSLFNDPLAHRLAGPEGKGRGVSLVVPRTRFMDDFLCAEYAKGVRQAVLLGAGMDARAFRLGLHEMHFFEVDQATIFEVKEPLLTDVPLQAASRQCVSSMVEDSKLADKLIAAGLDPQKPSAWVLEGLMMYLNPDQTARMMTQVGRIAAPGSGVVHESLSAKYLSSGIVYCGAKFTGYSDDYGELWAQHAGFSKSEMLDFSCVSVDRNKRALRVNKQRGLCTKATIKGKTMMYFTTAWK